MSCISRPGHQQPARRRVKWQYDADVMPQSHIGGGRINSHTYACLLTGFHPFRVAKAVERCPAVNSSPVGLPQVNTVRNIVCCFTVFNLVPYEVNDVSL